MTATAPDLHAVAAELELLAALLARPSALGLAEWAAVLGRFPGRQRRVVVLHGLLGMSFGEVGERLGVTRTRADQIWRTAMPKLRDVAGVLAGETRTKEGR